MEGSVISQLTLTGDKIPIPDRNPERELTPAEIQIYNFLLKIGPRTEKQIHLHPAFTKYATIGNKLRSMRQKGYLDNIQQRDKPQLWRAKF